MLKDHKLWLLAVVLTALLVFGGGSALAAGTSLGDFAPGSVVTVSGNNAGAAGWTAGETVHVAATAPDGSIVSGDATADDAGAWSCGLSLAGDAVTGDYSYTAAGLTSGVSQSGTFTVTAPAASSAPWIKSDQADYAPASTVTLTSGNWQPGEAVSLLVNDSIGQTWQSTANVTADASGAFTYQVVLPDSFVATYSVTATGTGGDSATTTFTDAIGSISPTSGPEGSSFVLTVNRSGGLAYNSTSRIVFGGTTLTTTLVTNARLTATVPASLVADEGTVAVTVSGAGAGGTGVFTITEGDVFTLTPKAISATSNAPFSGTVATLGDTYDNTATGTFTATINWGDGSAPSTGTVTRTGAGTYDVTGSHTWAAPFQSTTVKTATAYPAATIPVANNGTTSFPTAGTLVVFTGSGYQTVFYTGKTGGTSATFTGVTGWTGSGTLAVGNPITQSFNAVGVTVSENAPGTATASTSSPLTVADGMTYAVSAGPFSTTEGQTYTGASPFFPGSIFTGNTFPSVGLYRLLVSNGATSAWYTLYTSGPNNYMYPNSTTGSVVFGDEGTVPYTETLYLNNGVQVASGGGNVTVNDAPLSYFGAVNSYPASEGASTGTIQVGKFLDSYVGDGDHSADFTVTVHWGDGSSDAVPAVYAGSNAYTVRVAHTYAEEGTYAATYDVLDDGGSHLTGVSTATIVVADPAVVLKAAAPLTTTYGTPLGTQPLATFTDPGGAEANDGTHYAATIDWGSGFGTSDGTISVSAGTFTVSGAVPYVGAGSYAPVVTVTHESSTAQQVTDSVKVDQAVLKVTADNKTKVLNAPNPPLTYTITGFVNGDTAAVVSGSAVCTTTATTASPVGTYPITFAPGNTLAADNYSFTFIDGKLTIGYAFSGFLQPINDTAHSITGAYLPLSVFKGGSTIPVKFQLLDANGVVVQSATAPQWTIPISAGKVSAPVDESVPTDSPMSGSAYSWDGQQYHYNWSTKGFATGNYWKIGVQFDGPVINIDGSVSTTEFINIGLK
jgi:hypothetical protein